MIWWRWCATDGVRRMPAKKNRKNVDEPTGKALVKELCRRIRLAGEFWAAHNNKACRRERDRATGPYGNLGKAERERVPQVLRVWPRYRSEKHFGGHRTKPGTKSPPPISHPGPPARSGAWRKRNFLFFVRPGDARLERKRCLEKQTAPSSAKVAMKILRSARGFGEAAKVTTSSAGSKVWPKLFGEDPGIITKLSRSLPCIDAGEGK